MIVLLMNPLTASGEMDIADIGLGYLAAGLRREGIASHLCLRRVREEEFRALFARLRPDIVGIKVMTANVPETVRTVGIIRQLAPVPIVIGGPHVTGDPAGAFRHIGPDFAIQGEGDLAFPRLVSLLARKAPVAEIATLPACCSCGRAGSRSTPRSRSRISTPSPSPRGT